MKPQSKHTQEGRVPITELFTVKDAARAAGMEPRRLTTILDRQLIECDRPGTGKARQFTVDDVARIGLMNRFLALRLPPSEAARITFVHYEADGLLALDAAGNVRKVASADDISMAGGGVTLVDMGASYRSVVERLKAAA
jgi:hypothetical protein